MKTVGIICEYNPLHLGHQHQLERIRQAFGPDSVIVCCMSGNYVQRGHPAMFDKSIRAKAAILAGADLVLELPITAALSSAEGFARSGVEILAKCCDTLCFGTESMDALHLMQTAEALLSPGFSQLLKAQLDTGCSFPAARQVTLEQLGISADLASPNNILAVEYCKAILAGGYAMDIFPIHRPGSYHASTIDRENPSATSLRRAIQQGKHWQSAVPMEAVSLFENADIHCLDAGERAMLARLRTMTDAEFEALPYGSEGLWRKLMKASRAKASLPGIIEEVKSKRYTRSRIDRMILCAFLGISQEMLEAPVPYARVLAFNRRGRALLREDFFRNAGERIDSPYWELEQHCGSLYGLFSLGRPEPPDIEAKRRIYFHREEA